MASTDMVHCSHCDKDVAYHYAPINHGKHLLYSVCSLGLWLPIWLFTTFAPSKLCNECGNPLWSTEVPQSPGPRRKSS